MLILLQLLDRQNGVSYEEIVAKFGCSKRTAQRYIEDLKLLAPIESEERNRQKRFFIPEGVLGESVRLPALSLTSSEITSLMFLWARADIFQDTTMKDEIDRAFNKIFTIQPEPFKRYQELSAIVIDSSIQKKDYAGKEKDIELLVDAMLEHRCCRISYHSFHFDDVKSYIIKPLYLFQRDGGLYIFTTINDHADIRNLAVERIREIETTDECFIPPLDFDPKEYLETTFGLFFGEPHHFVIRFSKSVAPYIKQKRWAKDQTFRTEKDGNMILEMTTSGWKDIKQWVLSFGPDAELLEPEELRQQIHEELKETLKKY